MAIANADLIMAPPASRPVIIAIGIVLVVVAVLLLLLTAVPTAKLVSGVALANVTSAIIIAFWLAALWPRFSRSGHLIVLVTIIGLIVLALLELLSTMSDATEA